MLKRKPKSTYGKEGGDGVWKLELYPLENPTAFAKWGFQRYKMTPLGWVEMGNEERFSDRKVAENYIFRLGFSRVA